MEYFFGSKENQSRLKQILDSWLGTPWRHHCGVKGQGVDCIHLVARVLEEIGIIKWRKNLIPDYPPDWHLHNTRELLKECLEKEVYGEWVSLTGFQNGDILLSHFGKASSHAGIYFDGYVYQAINDARVMKINVKDRYFAKHLKFNYRTGIRK